MNEDWVIIGEKYVLIHSSENVVVPSRGSALIDTGLRIKLPLNTYGRIAPMPELTWGGTLYVGGEDESCMNFIWNMTGEFCSFKIKVE